MSLRPTILLATLIVCLATRATALDLPKHVRQFGPVASSRVKGGPEPPPPYKAERVYPNLTIKQLITAAIEPGREEFIFVDRPKSNFTRLRRTIGGPTNGEAETLLEVEETIYSIAFHPGFATNGFLYTGSKTMWQERPHKEVHINRYTISRSSPSQIEPESKKLIIKWPSNGHDGAALAFGLDGKLFVTTGDGTSDSDDDNRGQGLDHILAKTLRIDVDYPDPGKAYSVPADNPFVGVPNAAPETWAYGFRNPWRAHVDRKTGHLWVTQNGQDASEQVYRVTKGANYGWSVFEGSRPFRPTRKLGPTPVSIPTAEHFHHEARSLTGGVVYHGHELPALKGAYIYADYSTGKIWAIKHDGEKVAWHKEIADTTLGITGFLEGPEGELLTLDYQPGEGSGFFRLVPNTATNDPKSFPRKLSESGLFASVKDHQLRPEVIPYSVNAELWSDGAHKARFLALPTAEATEADAKVQMQYSARRGWEFPNGTVAIKSFGLEFKEGDPTSRRWIETRFLTRQEGEWFGYSYRWNDEQTDATLVKSEGLDQEFSIRTKDGKQRRQTWRYPGRAECMVCHTRAAKYVLGLSTLQLNRAHNYGQGFAANQMEVLNELGLLASAPKNKPLSEQPKLVDPRDESADLDLRARSYLQSNCAICHVGAGGGDAQFDLEFHLPLDKTKLVNTPPVHDALGLNDAKLLVPGKPKASLLWQRVARRGPGQMPPLASSAVDPHAVKLLHDWIAGMPSTPTQ